ncbi:hypothetical protein GCM10027570_08810 [Streptomonospora sediminis]
MNGGGDTGGAEGTWVSAHIFHAGSLDRMALELVAPLRAEPGTGIGGLFFLRYWEGGPHLRLRVRARGPAGPVRRLVADRAVGYLARNPSERTLTEPDYRHFAAAAARGERLAGHDHRLQPNDTVRFIGYRPEHRAFGDSACIRAAERHFTESSAVALELLARRPGPGQRSALGVAALTAALAVCEPDLARAARAAAALSAPVSPPIEAALRRDRAGLIAQTRACWAGPPRSGPLAAWAASLTELRDRLTGLGAEPADAVSPLSFLAQGPVPATLLRCTHLLNNRLGIAITAETRLALLVARILTELHEESANGRTLV